MSDSFGRHNSTRWVKASVPSYGDEWGDDEYGDDTGVAPVQTITEETSEPSSQRHSPAPTTTPTPAAVHSAHEGEEFSQPKGLGISAYTEKNGSDLPAHAGVDLAPEHGEPASFLSKSIGGHNDATFHDESASVSGNLPSNRMVSPQESFVPPQESLVLSIDNFRSRQDSDSSDDDFDIGYVEQQSSPPEPKNSREKVPSPPPSPPSALRTPSAPHTNNIPHHTSDILNELGRDTNILDSTTNNSTSSAKSKQVLEKIVIPTDRSFDGQIMPPTPTYNTSFTAETPQSDRSFASDADSIQKETDLFVKSNNFEDSHHSEAHSDIHKQNTIKQLPINEKLGVLNIHDATPLQSIVSEDAPEEIPPPAPLVLSIDKRGFRDDVDSDDDDNDDWGYNSKNNSSDEDDEFRSSIPPTLLKSEVTLPKSPEATTVGGSTAEHSSHRQQVGVMHSELDELISDLQNDSFNQDLNAPEYQAYLSDSDEDVAELSQSHAPVFTPTEPLTTSGHKRSIRKPPPLHDAQDLAGSNHGSLNSTPGAELPTTANDDMVSEEPVPAKRYDLVENDGESGGLHLPARRAFDTESFSLNHANESTGSLSTGKFSFAPSHLSNQMVDVKSLPLLPTQISGNASASSSSFDPPAQRFDSDMVSRRESTMTTNTFNMGNWQPNTNNFRDQFINDNDNESRMSYIPSLNEVEGNAYSRFMNSGNKLGEDEQTRHNFDDNESTNLGLSIPETIDATAPRTHNEDDEEEEEDENEVAEFDRKSLNPVTTETDSVFKDHTHLKPLFKEENIIPMSSMLDVVKDEKFDNVSTGRNVSENSGTRVVSGGSGISNSSSQSKTTKERNASVNSAVKLGGAYPPYNWKNIMAKSQCIDRIELLREASKLENEYDSGLNHWLSGALKESQESPTIHIGKIATAAYQNAPHNDIRRHASIRSRVKIVTGAVETSGFQASSFGKKFFNKGKKFIKSSD